MRGGKRFITETKGRKGSGANASVKPRKNVKLSSEDWYRKAAAKLSIKATSVAAPPVSSLNNGRGR
jgi:hypothetical protein